MNEEYLCFGAERRYLPQIMVPRGGREAKALFLAF